MTEEELEAAALLEEVRAAKRDAHRARRRTHSALNKLEQLKRRCAEYNIRLVVDGQIIYAGKALKEEQGRNDRSPDDNP